MKFQRAAIISNQSVCSVVQQHQYGLEYGGLGFSTHGAEAISNISIY